MSSNLELEDMHLLRSDTMDSKQVSESEGATEGTVTGWDRPIIFLFLHVVADLLWGIALTVFATGIVAVPWTLSQWGMRHTAVVNVLVTVVATVSTTHVQYVVVSLVEVYATARVVKGFTLVELQIFQSVKQWQIWPPFTDIKRRLIWLLLYGGMALHSASIVAIMQPQSYVQNVAFNDSVPCAVDPDSLTLDPSPHIAPILQSSMDQASYGIGLQLGNYYGETLDHIPSSMLKWRRSGRGKHDLSSHGACLREAKCLLRSNRWPRKWFTGDSGCHISSEMYY